MCYRTSAVFTDIDVIEEKDFEVDTVLSKFQPRYNLAPTQKIPVIIPGSRILDTMRWGLIPSWAKDTKIGSELANARSESIDEKPSFRDSFKNKRCLVLASGFFEWDKLKNPYLFRIKNKKIFAFAGLWSEWSSPEHEIIKSCTIITCDPNSTVKKIHQRMPVILQPKDYTAWLTGNSPKDLKTLLVPIKSDFLEYYEVTKKMNSPIYESPDILQPIVKNEQQQTL